MGLRPNEDRRALLARPHQNGQYALVRSGVRALAQLGRMPEETATVEVIQEYERFARELEPPATDDEARALLDVLPADDSTCFGLAWSVLHFIESAPGWPDVGVLDDRSWWVTFLRERAERGGLLPRP